MNIMITLAVSSILRNVPITGIRDTKHAFSVLNMMSIIYGDDELSNKLIHTTYDQVNTAGWVLIFDRDTAIEGIYCVEDLELSVSSVLAFQHLKDAHSFATHLTTKGYSLSTPLHWSADMISCFCEAGGFQVVVAETVISNSQNIRNKLDCRGITHVKISDAVSRTPFNFLA